MADLEVVNLIRELGLFAQVVAFFEVLCLGWKLKLCETTTSTALVFYHKTKPYFSTANTDHHVSIHVNNLFAMLLNDYSWLSWLVCIWQQRRMKKLI